MRASLGLIACTSLLCSDVVEGISFEPFLKHPSHSRVLKNWHFWTVMLKTLESPLDYRELQPVNTKGNQSWIFTGRTDAETEAPILWPPDSNNWLIRKDPDAEKDWRQEKGMTEDEMVGWHHLLNGHEFEQTLVVGDGQGGLAAAVHEVEKSQTWLSDWTTTTSHSRRFSLHDFGTPTKDLPS